MVKSTVHDFLDVKSQGNARPSFSDFPSVGVVDGDAKPITIKMRQDQLRNTKVELNNAKLTMEVVR